MDTRDYRPVPTSTSIMLHPRGVHHIDVSAHDEDGARWLLITTPVSQVSIFMDSREAFQDFADKVSKAIGVEAEAHV